MTANKRITSIDALRGFDMLMLCGGALVLRLLLQAIWGADLPKEVESQFFHANWGGDFTCWDLVMPLFIFTTGASMPFAFSKYRELGGNHWRLATTWRVSRRVIILFLLGMLVQGNLASADADKMSLFCNTLQAIAEGYFIAAIVLMFFKLRGQLIMCLTSLVVYWALLRFVPFNNHEGGTFEAQHNLALYIDCLIQGKWQDGTPYTWILTALSFGALTLMGSICGTIIKEHQGIKTALYLTVAGGACLGAACLLEFDTPLIKHIYTTTCVLWAGGWCVILLALFHLIFDYYQHLSSYLAIPLQIFGCNAILAYLLTNVYAPNGGSMWNGLINPLIYGLARESAPYSALTHSFLSLCLLSLLLYFLFRKKIFLKV